MKRIRWALLLLVGLVVVGAAASSVLAGSQAKQSTTYWNHAIGATSPSAGAWLAYNQSATWTFSNVSELQYAQTGSVYLNFAGLSKSLQIGGGAGYSTTVKVVVSGASTATYTVTLANPWRPHVAFNASPGVGWQAYASLNLPTYLWRNAGALTVKLTSTTTNTFMNLGEGGVMIGYATAE